MVTDTHPMINWRLFSELFIDNVLNLTQFILLNARNVNNKLPELYDLLYCMQYNVIIMNESWLRSSSPDGMIDPQGLYTVTRCDRESQFAAGGVCIFVSKIYNVVVVVNVADLCPELEICCIDLLHDNTRCRVIGMQST